jgi:tubulin--tyrosine ligase-like protein 12
MEAVFEGSGIPQHLWTVLLQKLSKEVFDAGLKFSLAQDEEGTFEVSFLGSTVYLQVIVSTAEGVSASDPDSIWLIDHAWTYMPEKGVL